MVTAMGAVRRGDKAVDAVGHVVEYELSIVGSAGRCNGSPGQIAQGHGGTGNRSAPSQTDGRRRTRYGTERKRGLAPAHQRHLDAAAAGERQQRAGAHDIAIESRGFVPSVTVP